jgi:steroid delta-isomerase-like uncharacterized protein
MRRIVLRQHDAVWCRGDLSAVDELFAADFVGRHPGAPDWIGRRAVKDIVTAVRTGFPDFKEVVEDVVVAGEKVVTRFTASGTRLGPFMGLAPTGKSTSFAEVGIFRVVDGKIVEKWGLRPRPAACDRNISTASRWTRRSTISAPRPKAGAGSSA